MGRQTTSTSEVKAAVPAPHILIVQRDQAYAELLDQYFTNAGFPVVRCTGPQPPDYRCYLLETEPTPARREANWGKPRLGGSYGCRLVESADVLVYDPWLYTQPGSPDARNLVLALRRYYPDQPLVLAWPHEGMPALGTGILTDPGVHVGPSDPGELVDFVAAIAGPCRHTSD